MRAFPAMLAHLALGSAWAAAAAGPCSLLTKEEIRDATGKTVAEMEPRESILTGGFRLYTCSFRLSDAGSGLILSVTAKQPLESVERMITKLSLEGKSAEAVPGLGDGAWQWTATTSRDRPGVYQLGVFKGTRHVMITMMMGAPKEKVREIAEKLIRQAMTRL